MEGFTELEILDFCSEDIKQFVKNWFASKKRTDIHDLLSRLERNPRIQTLAANPLLLSLIIILYEAQLDLPDRRSELYKQYVAALLTEWDRHRNIHRRSEFEPAHKRKLLEEVAWNFHLKGQCYFPEDDLLAVIAGFLQGLTGKPEQNRQILAEIAAEHGLLNQQAQGLYSFLHLTLQEYFVAQYAIDHNQLDTLLAHRGDPWWEEVILLYAGCTFDFNPLLQKLLGKAEEGAVQEDFFYTNLILAGRSLATRPTYPSISMQAKVIDCLLSKLKETNFSLTREQIANVLVEIGGPDVNYHLLSLFCDKDTDLGIRQSIAIALCTQGDRSVVRELLHRFTDNQTELNIRQNIAEVLGILGEPSLAHDLLVSLTDVHIAHDVDMRLSIVNALGMLGERSIAHTLLSQFSIEANPRIRQGIVEALGVLGEYTIVPELVKLLSAEVDVSVRESIVGALGMLGEKSIAQALLKQFSLEGYVFVRQSIAVALGTLGERGVAQQLVKLLSDEVDPSVRGSIAYALGILGEKSVAHALLERFSFEGKVYVRQRIAIAIGMLGERSMVPALQNLFHIESDLSVRGSIAAAIGKLGERSIFRDLLQLLTGQTDPIVCRSIAEALSILGERQSVLEQLRQLANPRIDASVRELLRQLANPRIDENMRKRIAKVLVSLDKTKAIEELLQLLSKQQLDPYVRTRIALVLEHLADDEKAVRALTMLLEGSDIIDSIHRTLWMVSRKAGVTIIKDGLTSFGELKIVGQRNAPGLQHDLEFRQILIEQGGKLREPHLQKERENPAYKPLEVN